MAIEVTRTYLEMTDPSELCASANPDPLAHVERVLECPPGFYRFLYAAVGEAYHWVDRLDWTDEQIERHLSAPLLRLFVLYRDTDPAGFFELHQEGESVEIAYFGLLPAFLRRGLGKYLLTQAASEAWRLRPRRVWLHTCTLDDPAALPNYLKRGFRPFKDERYNVAESLKTGRETLNAVQKY